MAEGLTLNDETLLFFFNNREKDSISANELYKGTGRSADRSRISFLKAAGMLLTVNPHESPWRYRITKLGETRVDGFSNSTKRLLCGTVEPTILKHLRDNADLEFQAHKIVEATGISRTSISTVLSRLVRAGKINANKDHGKPWYYSIAGKKSRDTLPEVIAAVPNIKIVDPPGTPVPRILKPGDSTDDYNPTLALKKSIQQLKVNSEETVFLARNVLEQAMDAITVSETRYKSASKRIAELTEEAEAFSVLKKLIAKMS